MSAPIAVLGAGNWGTVLAHLAARNGHEVRLWTIDPSLPARLEATHTTPRVPGLTVHPGVHASTDLAGVLLGAGLVVIAIPSQAFREVCRQAAEVLVPEQLVIHATKGLELKSHARMSQILLEETCVRQLGVLAGPNIAAEVAEGKPAGTVIASALGRVVDAGRRAFSSRQLMVFAGADVLGVELCSALKNVVAIAAGLADEMKVGENTKAFLVTRGLTELMRLGFALGAQPTTMMGLAGVGDLMVTCASPLSRNHRIGVALARGVKLEEAVAQLGMVAEGVYASIAARELAHAHGVEMPLFDRVDRVLHGGLAPAAALEELMRLPAGRDVPRFAAAALGRPAQLH